MWGDYSNEVLTLDSTNSRKEEIRMFLIRSLCTQPPIYQVVYVKHIQLFTCQSYLSKVA